jgi:uncharacterized membrane protein YqjE
MPRPAKQTRIAPRPAIGPLVRQLAGDSVRWMEAELTLARAELQVLRRRSIGAVVFAAIGLAAMLTALITLAQAAVAAATDYLGSAAWAGIAVAAGFLIIAAICVWGIRRMFSWETDSVFFRWFSSSNGRRRPWSR